MNTKLMRTLCMAVVLVMVVMAAAGCQSSNSTTSNGDGKSAALTEDEYLKKVQEIASNMQNIQGEITEKMQGLDPTDVEAVQKVLGDLKAPFNEFASLQAPEKYAAAQAKYKSGCEAMVQFIDITIEMSGMGADADATKVQEKTTEMMEVLTKATQDLTEADKLINEVK